MMKLMNWKKLVTTLTLFCSKNVLSLDLFKIPFWVRLKKINRNGFFWKPDGLFSESQERIDPDTKRSNEK